MIYIANRPHYRKMSDIGSEDFEEDEGINLGVSKNTFVTVFAGDIEVNSYMSILSRISPAALVKSVIFHWFLNFVILN